jgi:predicted DNA-binding transcriptional regulator YafY|tara:strand:- start:5251 stop:5493 length:243 start_codon:yes stop_codon:yes gene_type:complete
MKLSPIQKTRLAIRRAFAKENMATIRYNKKSDDTTGDYLIDMNFIEDFGKTFNTYSYATSAKQGGIRTFYKDRISYVELV